MPYSICSTGDHIMLLLFGRVSSSSWSMLWRPFHRTSWKVFPYDLRFSLAKAGLGLVVKGSLTNQGPVTLSLLKQNGQAKRIRPLMLLTKKKLNHPSIVEEIRTSLPSNDLKNFCWFCWFCCCCWRFRSIEAAIDWTLGRLPSEMRERNSAGIRVASRVTGSVEGPLDGIAVVRSRVSNRNHSVPP